MELQTGIPSLDAAIRMGLWRDPGPEMLSQWLRLPVGEVLGLFSTVQLMKHVAHRLDVAGYIDGPQFCMIRNRTLQLEEFDARLSHASSVFLAGSKYPGDDVFVAVDLSRGTDILVFDWDRPIPYRWVSRGPVDDFVAKVVAHASGGQG